MEHTFTAYRKQLQGIDHYFVKKIQRFPEYDGVADVVIGYGMHHNFDKACAIAGLHDAALKARLFSGMKPAEPVIYAQHPLPKMERVNLKTLAGKAIAALN